MKKIILLGFAITLFSNFAEAKPSSKNEDILELENTIEEQGKTIATLSSQVQDLITTTQKLQGSMDQTVYQNNEQLKIIEEGQRRIEKLEDRVFLLAKQIEEFKKAKLVPAPQAKDFEEFQVYEQAMSLFNGDQTKLALEALQNFVKTYPKSAYGAHAQYWVGECYLALQDYPNAVTEFQKVVSKFATSEKAPTAMLRQGVAFFKMKEYQDAKDFLTSVIAKYPKSPDATLARNYLAIVNKQSTK